jgi:23S rRNA (uracil1939-C5)-methyltransferase
MDYHKNQILTVTIDDIGAGGEGIGKFEGYTLFIKDAVPGDVVEARLTKIKKNYAYARCEKIITPSKKRAVPFCREYRRCGGCQIQALSYEEQLRFKENKVKNDLARIGGIPADVIESVFEPIIAMDEPKRYRNKSQYPIGTDANGNPVAGFYAGRTHSIIPCTDCGLAPEENSMILGIILDHMRQYKIPAYDESKGSGIIRHVMVRKGYRTGEIMVCLVITHTQKGLSIEDGFIPEQSELIEKLCTVQGMTSVCVSINNDNTNVIMGNEIHTLFGSDKINDVLLGKKFEISPLSFYQINPVQVEKLYSTAIEYANLSGIEEVWDVCCGIGTISICMSGNAKLVHGLEIVPEAIEDAKKNAKLNGIENADFICAAAEDYLPAHKEDITADVIVLDPPRKGMDEAALCAIADVSPDRIVYVSCDSATLARDIKYLTGRGYEVKRIRCTDMFPQTVHVETVCLLSNTQSKKKESYITLDVEMADYYRIKNEGKNSTT